MTRHRYTYEELRRKTALDLARKRVVQKDDHSLKLITDMAAEFDTTIQEYNDGKIDTAAFNEYLADLAAKFKRISIDFTVPQLDGVSDSAKKAIDDRINRLKMKTADRLEYLESIPAKELKVRYAKILSRKKLGFSVFQKTFSMCVTTWDVEYNGDIERPSMLYVATISETPKQVEAMTPEEQEEEAAKVEEIKQIIREGLI